jgi:hypothetical protein
VRSAEKVWPTTLRARVRRLTKLSRTKRTTVPTAMEKVAESVSLMSERRTSTLSVYVTPSERDKLEAWSRGLGLSISTAARAVLLPYAVVTGELFRSSETELVDTDPLVPTERMTDEGYFPGDPRQPGYVTELDGTEISGRGQTR